MLFEIASSAVVGGLIGYSYLASSGSTNEGKRIIRICENAGLSVKGESMRLLRRSRREWGVEYAYRIPLGKSLADYEARLEAIRDGLNAKGTFDMRKVIEALKRRDKLLLARSIRGEKTKKDVELDYDGVLRVRVYEKGIPERFEFTEELFERLSGWQVPVGVTRDKLVRHDFDKHAHLIVAGMTDYGKSVFLKNVITTLVKRKPDDSHLYLIDLKGGLAFNRFAKLSQVNGLAKDPSEAFELLTEVQSKMNDRIEYLLRNGYEDIKEAGDSRRYFVVIDEAADISGDKACQAIIKDIARRGRGAGFRLIYATQYPTNETLSPQVRQNCSARLCFRLNTEVASRAVIDEGGAEKLPLIKGRAIYSTDRKEVVQTPLIENTFIDEVIKPHINIRPRRERANHAISKRGETASSRGNPLVIEEIGLS